MTGEFSKLRAVLFDFDGTLADSYPAITASVNHLRARQGLAALPEAEVRRHVGRGPPYLLEHTVPGSDFARDWPLYQAHHPTVMRAGTYLLPGAADLLAALKARHLLLGVCSNKPRLYTSELLHHLELARYLNIVVGPEDVPRPKPAPDMLLAALDHLNIQAAEALYVGDMSVDIETARGAGVAVWVIPSGSDERSTLEAARPDRLLDSLLEFASLLALSGG